MKSKLIQEQNDLIRLGIRRMTAVGCYIAAIVLYSNDKCEETERIAKLASFALLIDMVSGILPWLTGLITGKGEQA